MEPKPIENRLIDLELRATEEPEESPRIRGYAAVFGALSQESLRSCGWVLQVEITE